MVRRTNYKVLHFLSSGDIGGQQKAQYHILESFKNDKEFEIDVAIGRERGLYVKKIIELGIPIIYLNLKGGFSFNFNKQIINKLKEYNIHHLHDPSPNYIIYSLLAGKHVKRVFTRRGGFAKYTIFRFKKKIKFHIKKFLIKKYFNGFSGNTINATESVRQQYGIKNRKIHVLYNGIDFNILNPVEDKQKIFKTLKLDCSEFLIGTACKLADLKRVDLIIRAFTRCNVKEKKLLIFGDGPEKENLVQLAKDLKLNNKVIFAGEVPNMPDYMQVFDCFILASGKAESFGNAVVEAMYLKIPSIIMNDNDGLKEHITDNKTGFIAKDEKDLAQKIEYIYKNSVESNNIAREASIYVHNKYSFENMVNAYKKFYLEILGKRNEA